MFSCAINTQLFAIFKSQLSGLSTIFFLDSYDFAASFNELIISSIQLLIFLIQLCKKGSKSIQQSYDAISNSINAVKSILI
jgi:hypothetical protein